MSVAAGAAPAARTAGADRPAAGAAAVGLALRAGLAGIATAALYAGTWLSLAPNRLLPGEGRVAAAVLGGWTHAVPAILFATIGIALLRLPSTRRLSLRFGLLLALLVALLILTGVSAATLLEGRPPAARVMVGAGFFTVMGCLALLLLDDAGALPPARIAWMAVAATLALAAANRNGAFEALSIFVEYRARAEAFHAAMARHLTLSLTALGMALAISIPLGWLAFRHPRIRPGVDAGLSGIQVVPAVALFGLLVSLLSLALAAFPGLRVLGLAAIGPTPALIGVAAYLALPLTRGIVSGLSAADPALIETAKGMGMTEARIAREVRLPLGLPVFVAGLRLAAVQSIGLVTLGGLIGAGGFGAVVFEGMAQFASDLIILGSAPVVAIAILADLALRAAELRLARPLS